MPEEKKKIENRSCNGKEKDIIDAAMRLFSRYGYAGTTTISIAEEAKVSEKTLFKYFHTKQELYDRTVYPLIKTMVSEKVSAYGAGKKEGVYGLIHDLYMDKIKMAKENPDQLKLTMHEFLMNPAFQSSMSGIWNDSYLSYIKKELDIQEEVREEYGEMLEDALTRIIVSILVAYAIDRTYIRKDKKFDDEKEIKLMLKILFDGINGLKDGPERKEHK